MAHYAFLDENNIVVQVICGKDENELIEGLTPEVWYGNSSGQTCVRTSYNSHGGEHSNGKANLRKNYAGIGYSYDSVRDAFISPKPYPSWTLDEATCYQWNPPTAWPTDGKRYDWVEADLAWVEIPAL